MKRRAPYDLDRNELEKNNYDLPDAPSNTGENPNEVVDLSKRRIVKLRNPSEVYASRGIDVNAQPTGKFTLAGQLDTGSTTENSNETAPSFLEPQKPAPSFLEQQKPAGSLFNNSSTHTGQKVSQNLWAGQSGAGTTNVTASMFFNNDHKKYTEPQPAENGNGAAKEQVKAQPEVQQQQQPEVKKGGLFDNIGLASNNVTSNDGGLWKQFSSETNKSKDESTEQRKSSLFANTDYTTLFGTGATTSSMVGGSSLLGGTLFQQQEKKTTPTLEKKPSLFANLMAEVDPKESATNTLFSNYLNNNNSTFEDLLKRSTSSNIFAEQRADNDNDNDGGDDDGDDGDDNPEGSKSPEPDLSKTTANYQYEEHFDKITFKPVEKFKLNDDADTKTGTVSLEKSKAAGTYHIVFRDNSKIIRFQGNIFKNLSRPKHIYENKPHTLSVIAYTPKTKEEIAAAETKKDGEGDKQSLKILKLFNQHVVKLMFPRSDECLQFKEAIEKALA